MLQKSTSFEVTYSGSLELTCNGEELLDIDILSFSLCDYKQTVVSILPKTSSDFPICLSSSFSLFRAT